MTKATTWPFRWRTYGRNCDIQDRDRRALRESAGGSRRYAVVWSRTIPYIVLHAACLGVFWVGWSWPAVAAWLGLHLLRAFFVTGFLHRYFSHRAFKTSRFGQFVLALCGASAAQSGPLWWAAHHREHHRHSDDERDAHSPCQHGLYWAHMGWLVSRQFARTDFTKVPDLAKYPELRFIDRHHYVAPLAMIAGLWGLGAWLAAAWPALGVSGLQMVVWGFFVSTVTLFHCTCLINSLCHTWGTRRYDTADDSRNNLVLALLTLGEGWHNNHHHYPGAARQGFYWWEIDITYYVLKGLSWTGLIWELTPVPERVLKARR